MGVSRRRVVYPAVLAVAIVVATLFAAAPASADDPEWEATLADLVDLVRFRCGVPSPVPRSDELHDQSQAWSDELLASADFRHDPNLLEQTPVGNYTSENLSHGGFSVQGPIIGWIGSDGHFATLVNQSHTEMGFGSASGATSLYATNRFRGPLPYVETLAECSPFGELEAIEFVAGSVRVEGWAIDPDAINPSEVRVTVDGAEVYRALTDVRRNEIGEAHLAWDTGVNRHGFDWEVPLELGPHEVCVTIVNADRDLGGPEAPLGVTRGRDVDLGCATGAVPECEGVAATIVGTEGDDLIEGTDERDVIQALGGDDTVRSGAGDDLVCAGDGDDDVDGGEGADLVLGGDGDDVLHGGAGDDVMRSGPGDDVVHGDDGDDHLDGGAGADRMFGAAGSDELHGHLGADRLAGGAGADRLLGGQGDDEVLGGVGADELFGGSGNDVLRGGAGPDVLSGNGGDDEIAGDAGADRLFGMAGADRLDGGGGNDLLVNHPDDVLGPAIDRYDVCMTPACGLQLRIPTSTRYRVALLSGLGLSALGLSGLGR